MSQPPPSYYPPPIQPARKQPWGVIVIVIVAIVIVASFASYGVSQVYRVATTPRQPNIVITDSHAQNSCPVFATPRVDFTATLVNTGASGYASLNFILNGQSVTSNTYFVASSTTLPIVESTSLTSCPNAASSTFTISIASQWAA